MVGASVSDTQLISYLKKDDEGRYKIPLIRQRPVLLMGPPGIGKTQIMEQIAEECKIGLVAYTITHHTRQSAVGLPFIKYAVTVCLISSFACLIFICFLPIYIISLMHSVPALPAPAAAALPMAVLPSHHRQRKKSNIP